MGIQRSALSEVPVYLYRLNFVLGLDLKPISCQFLCISSQTEESSLIALSTLSSV